MADDEEAGVGGWVVPAAIDLWSASFCPAGSGNPARGGLRQFQAPNTITAATRSPAVSGKHNSETAAHPTGDTVENSGIKLSLKMRGWQND